MALMPSEVISPIAGTQRAVLRRCWRTFHIPLFSTFPTQVCIARVFTSRAVQKALTSWRAQTVSWKKFKSGKRHRLEGLTRFLRVEACRRRMLPSVANCRGILLLLSPSIAAPLSSVAGLRRESRDIFEMALVAHSRNKVLKVLRSHVTAGSFA